MLVRSGNCGVEDGGVCKALIFAFGLTDSPLVIRPLESADGGAFSLGLDFPLMQLYQALTQVLSSDGRLS